jgi:hypothetical protein
MFRLSEKQSRDAFRKKESFIKYTFYSIIAFMAMLNGTLAYSFVEKWIFKNSRLFEISLGIFSYYNIFMLLLLAGLGLTLLYQLK